MIWLYFVISLWCVIRLYFVIWWTVIFALTWPWRSTGRSTSSDHLSDHNTQKEGIFQFRKLQSSAWTSTAYKQGILLSWPPISVPRPPRHKPGYLPCLGLYSCVQRFITVNKKGITGGLNHCRGTWLDYRWWIIDHSKSAACLKRPPVYAVPILA